ncbi:EGF domain-specific O-linked N-acetylglucosamine transferase-like protein [Tanacetum coccineum]
MMIKSGKIQKANKKSLNAKGKNKVKGNGKDKKVYIPQPKNPKPTAMERPAKDDVCHHCKEVGHCKRNCPAYLVELIKKKKQYGTASSSECLHNRSYFLFLQNPPGCNDTSCGLNLYNTKHGLGGTIVIMHLLTRGVVSVHHLVENEFVQCFTDFGISVSKNNVFYFNAIHSNVLGDLREPANYNAAMLDPESNKWIDAMNVEIQSMMDNMVWVLVDLPSGCKTSGNSYEGEDATLLDSKVPLCSSVSNDTLISENTNASTIENRHNCDVNHNVPAVFFSTGGFTGNVYHEFNDGLIPLFITSQKYNKKVVFVILEYHDWWVMKYGDVVSRLSDYEPIDFNGDNRTHCFSEAIVGLRIHDELAINSTLMEDSKTIEDFHDILDKAYWPRIQDINQELMEVVDPEKPKLVIISRNGSRAVTNQELLVKMAEKIGFLVEVLWPDKTTELPKIYRSLNSSDVMIGVHGAAMTHFLFMKPVLLFYPICTLGTTWAAETFTKRKDLQRSSVCGILGMRSSHKRARCTKNMTTMTLF